MKRSAVFSLMREHARSVGYSLPEKDSNGLHGAIYEAVGGNPLAVKLVVGLAGHLDLHAILSDLVTARHRDIHSMYQNIYLHSWQRLSEEAQRLLMVMPLATERGMTMPLMEVNSDLDFGALGAAIAELKKRSLIDVSGSATARRYSIHQLTRAFLGSSVIEWPGDMLGS